VILCEGQATNSRACARKGTVMAEIGRPDSSPYKRRPRGSSGKLSRQPDSRVIKGGETPTASLRPSRPRWNSADQAGATRRGRNSSTGWRLKPKREISSWALQTRAEARRAQGARRRAGAGRPTGAARGSSEQADQHGDVPFRRWQADGLTGGRPEAHQHHAEQNRERVGRTRRRC